MEKLIGPSGEDYLEAILIRIRRDGACRVTDVAEQMGVSKASASVALKKLEKEGCVLRDDWRVLLSGRGSDIAERVYERHVLFRSWFRHLGVDEATAEEDACRLEHVVSEETCEKLRQYIIGLLSA